MSVVGKQARKCLLLTANFALFWCSSALSSLLHVQNSRWNELEQFVPLASESDLKTLLTISLAHSNHLPRVRMPGAKLGYNSITMSTGNSYHVAPISPSNENILPTMIQLLVVCLANRCSETKAIPDTVKLSHAFGVDLQDLKSYKDWTPPLPRRQGHHGISAGIFPHGVRRKDLTRQGHAEESRKGSLQSHVNPGPKELHRLLERHVVHLSHEEGHSK